MHRTPTESDDKLTLPRLLEGRGAMYSRTQNENGTFNTRCLHCFMTIASAVEKESELEAIEAHHMCPEKILAELVADEDARAAKLARN